MTKFNKLYESLLSQAAPNDSNIRDDQIGNVYIWLVKSGNSFIVKKGSGDDINRTTMKKVASFKDYDSALKKYYSVRGEVFDNIEKQ